MSSLEREFRARRVYDTQQLDGGALALQLSDRVVELAATDARLYRQIVDWLPTPAGVAELATTTGLDATRLSRALDAMAEAGLFYHRADVPESVSGEELHRGVFSRAARRAG